MKNLRRFALHLAFAAAGAFFTYFAANASGLSADVQTTAVIVAFATAAASFFRGKAAGTE